MFKGNYTPKVVLLFSTVGECALLREDTLKPNPLEFSKEAGRLATAQDDKQWASKALSNHLNYTYTQTYTHTVLTLIHQG